MDVPLLIAEIHKRPALWDVVHEEHRDRQSVPKLWQEVAEVVGVDVDQCKRKWKNLRDAYRAEIRRSERRIERDKLMGDYDPNTNYNSKWVYFPLMDFIGDNCLRKRCVCFKNENANNNTNNQHQNQEYDNDDDDDDVDNDVVINDADADEERNYNNSEYNENMNSACDIKSEPSHNNMDRNVRNFHDNTNAKQRAQEDEEEEAANDMLFEEFQNIATPQAARRLSACLSLNKSLQQNNSTMQEQQQQHQNISPSSSTANNKANTNNNCSKCSQRTVDQVHFLEDLGREEQKLIKSTRQDMTRSNNLDHIGDSDYNFLVSFLPQMKKMTELQNLQFRARMCDMVLNIFSPPPTTTTNVDNLRAVRSQNTFNVSNSNERLQAMEVGLERSGGACGENSGNVVNNGFFD